MDSKALEFLGPCGINCQKCFAFNNGSIKKHSQNLLSSLGNFEIYAKRFAELLNEPAFEKYPDFKIMLERFTSSNCKGCRKQECHLFKSCKVRTCHKEMKVDFCFQCPDFPCNKTGFDEHLHNRWLTINNRMKEINPDAYYNEIKDKPRY